MTHKELIEAVNTICERLNNQLTKDDLKFGWTDSNRMYMLDYFKFLERDLRAGNKIRFFSLVRSLDAMGIIEGDLLEEMCRINNAVNTKSM